MAIGEADKRLTDFLKQEWDSAKLDCDKVLLTDTDSLFVSRAGANSSSERFEVDNEQWTISKIDKEGQTITLFRKNSSRINVIKMAWSPHCRLLTSKVKSCESMI